MDTVGENRMSGMRVLITGGSSGIGAATALLMRRHGARIAILDRNARPGGELATIDNLLLIETDVTRERDVTRSVDNAAQAMGGIDCVINCAGTVARIAFEETTFETWQRHLDVNLTGCFLVCKASLPHLRRSTSASIVNVASAQGITPTSHRAAYAASKGGVISFTKALAIELGPTIRVNAVCPGPVNTPFLDGGGKDEKPASLDDYPLARAAEAGEIASTILFLASRDASFVTGAILAVDGGRTCH